MKEGPWETLEGRIRPRKLSKKQEKQWDLLMFLVRLIILSAPLYVVLSVPGLLYPAQILATNTLVLILNGLGMNAVASGPSATIAGTVPFTFFITEDCTGWKSVMFLFALIFAVKGPKLRSRLAGLGLGAAFIFIGNTARLLATVLAQRAWGTDTALVLHDWLFRLGLVALVLGLWAFWLCYLNKKFK